MTKNENRLSGVGGVIGRFQTPVLHDGHRAVLDAANQHNKMLVLLGVHAVPGSYRHELDFETREHMIREAYPNAVVLPVYDCPSVDEWNKKLETMLHRLYPFNKVTIYHGRDSFAPLYTGSAALKDIGEVGSLNATGLREAVCEQVKSTAGFRSGVFYGLANAFPRLDPCVDIAITRTMTLEDKTTGLFVLLGKKTDGRGWRFPGGFIDITDENAEVAAVREAQEETGLEVSEGKYICSKQINDWRNTAKATIMTFFYHFDYKFGAAKAADDLVDVKWHLLRDIDKETMVPEHAKLLVDLEEYLLQTRKGE